MSLFGELDLDNAPDDPNAIPDATYKANLVKIRTDKSKRDPDSKYLVFTFKIMEGDFRGREIEEWKSCRADDDQQKKAYLKQRILSLGVPADQIRSVEMDDLLGTAVLITTKMNNDFVNIRKVVLDDESAGESDPAGAVDLGSY